MNKELFLRELREALAGLPKEEIDNALQYYAEYFEDAGPENEQAVLQELGKPSALAAQIRADIAMRGLVAKSPAPPSARKSISAVWWVILAILASPITFPMGVVILSVAIALVISVGAVFFSLLVVVVVLLAVGIIVGALGFVWIFSSFANGIACIGAGFICAGLSLLFTSALILVGRLLLRGLACLIDRIGRKRRDKKKEAKL